MQPDKAWVRQLAEQLLENMRQAGADPDEAEARLRAYHEQFRPLPLPGPDVVPPELDQNGGIKSRVAKFNPHHKPAGSSEGGQFAEAPSGGTEAPPAGAPPALSAGDQRLVDRMTQAEFRGFSTRGMPASLADRLRSPRTEADRALVDAVRKAAMRHVFTLMDPRDEGMIIGWDDHQPDEDQRQAQREHMRNALGNLPTLMLVDVAGNLSGIHLYSDEESMTKALYGKEAPFPKNPTMTTVGGAVTVDQDDGVRMHLDGDADRREVDPHGNIVQMLLNKDVTGTYLHEMGHVLDAEPLGTSASVVSDSGDWEEAWNRDIMNGALLTRYARTSRAEGFAEYIQLVGTDPRDARMLYPKCWAVLVKRGWVTDPTMIPVKKAEQPKLRELFAASRPVPGGGTADFALPKRARKGGPGSGFFGHAGRPGEVGGSQPGDATAPVPLDKLHTPHAQETLQAIYGRTGELHPGTNTLDQLKVYPLDRAVHDPAIAQQMLHEMGYKAEYFSFVNDPEAGVKFRVPNLKTKGYEDGYVWIYDPRVAHGSFEDTEYTRAWRLFHEVGHATTEEFLQEKYGISRREGRLGEPMLGVRGNPDKQQVSVSLAPLSLAQAQRAIEWEDTAFRAQRMLLDDKGITISEPDFNREYNVNITDAVYRVMTGDFGDPGRYGYLPSPRRADLHTLLSWLEKQEALFATSQGRAPTKGIDLRAWRPVSDAEIRGAIERRKERFLKAAAEKKPPPPPDPDDEGDEDSFVYIPPPPNPKDRTPGQYPWIGGSGSVQQQQQQQEKQRAFRCGSLAEHVAVFKAMTAPLLESTDLLAEDVSPNDRYRIVTSGDANVCAVCSYIESLDATFRVGDLLSQFESFMEAVEDELLEEEVESVPFPTMDDVDGLGVRDLAALGYNSPPYHPRCRCKLVLV